MDATICTRLDAPEIAKKQISCNVSCDRGHCLKLFQIKLSKLYRLPKIISSTWYMLNQLSEKGPSWPSCLIKHGGIFTIIKFKAVCQQGSSNQPVRPHSPT